MDKNRSTIVTQILRKLLFSGPVPGEEKAHLFVEQILTDGEEALVLLFLKIVLRVYVHTGHLPPFLPGIISER